MADGLVIVGGSYAGLQIAASLREQGWAEPIRLVAAERDPPYHRPPLSKSFVTGRSDESTLPLRAAAFYRDNAIELLTGCRVAAIDRAARRVTLDDGAQLGWDRLALTTGAAPLALPVPGSGLDGVMALRSLADARLLRERLAAAGPVAVIGAGFIGLEIAAALAATGRPVTVIEAQARPLARALAPPLAAVIAARLQAQGVVLRLGTAVAALEGAGRVAGVRCADGSRIAADLVVVAIGVRPETGLAAAAGLACSDGIATDAAGRTADPAIVAAGDVARRPSRFADGPCRLESVQAALDGARAVAAGIADRPLPPEPAPWFWSDIGDLKLQMVGLAAGADRSVWRGSPEEGRFSLFHFRAGRLLAIDSVNRPADHMLGRRLLAGTPALTPEQAGDLALDLRTIAG